MSISVYWISQAIAIDWRLTDIDNNPTDATVTGTITKPDGSTAAATITHPGATGRYIASHDPTMAGKHAYRLTATGAVDSAVEGYSYVNASLTGFQPITVDPTTSLGMVRLLIADLDPAEPYFTDAQLTALLTLEGASTRLAAAQALDVIASSEAMVSKKIRTQDLQTDGPAVAAELRARATGLRSQAAAGTGDPTTGVLQVVEFGVDDYPADYGWVW